MAYFTTATAPERRNPTEKNRVWEILPLSSKTHPANRRPSPQPRRKIRPTATKSASGIPYWPSRDPIGEDGGTNLYRFVDNGPIQDSDKLGLTINMLAPFYDTLANIYSRYGDLANTGDPLSGGMAFPTIEGSDRFEHLNQDKDGLCCAKVKSAAKLTINVRTTLPSNWGDVTNIDGTLVTYSRAGYKSTIKHEFRRRGVYERANRAFLVPAEKAGNQATKCGAICRRSFADAEVVLSKYLDDLRLEAMDDYRTYLKAEQFSIDGEVSGDDWVDLGFATMVRRVQPYITIHPINEPVPNWSTPCPSAK